MKTILVSGASGIVGYGILRSLRKSNTTYKLIGSSIHTDSIAPAFCDIFELAPRTDDPGYLNWLKKIIRQHEVDLLIPGIEADLYHWSAYRDSITQTGAAVALNNANLISLCEDKWNFFSHLKNSHIDCVIESSLNNNFDFLAQKFSAPFLIKPRRGYGSKGIFYIQNKNDLTPFINDLGPRMLAQPIVGNNQEEYTVAIFGDGRGSYSSCIALRRILSNGGFTEKAEVDDAKKFTQTIHELCQLFAPIGPTNLQFRDTPNGPKLLEINPRISSSTAIRAAFGYNESEMTAEYFLDGIQPEAPNILRGKAIRFIEEKIFYESSIHI
ncbi:ATP-grasp domain-containing protein [Comamonas terrigena]|uniref:ATP-grasp domain-containing protein n=1 Tax=Comamonas terrigena TaxID=32013 RepID=UPI00289D4924|nr:ATP-grasp domain-containing protein [Comamonas terrigena]